MNNQPNQTREVEASKLRELMAEVFGDLCDGLDTVRVALSGNTFEINLEGATVNIIVNESSTKSLGSAKKGGQQ